MATYMKKTIWLATATWMLALGTVVGQDAEKAASTAPAVPDQAALEKRFAETLTQATFVGRWCLVKDGELGPPKEETYTIQGAKKVSGELWIIQARIQYGQRDANVPVPVYVKWAGDTPVISLTDLAIPGLGTYTARVVVYGDTYAGTWSGGDHGGLMNGVIRRTPQD